jgi:multidrug efflux pump subunit AcrA (membrane-fusion protein)
MLTLLLLAGVSSGAAPAPAPVSVREVLPVRREVRRTIATGVVVTATRWLDVVAPAAGFVETITVDIGDRVRRGQLLATIAQRNARGKVTGKILVNAPFDGVIASRPITIGAYAAPTGPVLLALLDDAALRVKLGIPEVQVFQVRPGQPLSVWLDALPGREVRTTIERVGLVVHPATHTLAAWAPVSNPERNLRIGMRGRATIEIEIRPGALTIPTAAVARQNGASYVFRATGDRAHRIPVTLGIESGSDVEVLAGLTTTDAVLIPAAPLQDATPIRRTP